MDDSRAIHHIVEGFSSNQGIASRIDRYIRKVESDTTVIKDAGIDLPAGGSQFVAGKVGCVRSRMQVMAPAAEIAGLAMNRFLFLFARLFWSDAASCGFFPNSLQAPMISC